MNTKQRYKLSKIAFNIIELNDPAIAGYAIAQTIKFLFRNIPFSNRHFSIAKIKQKILKLNEKELAEKEIPTTAILGQSIAMIKNLLNGNDSKLIRNILINVYKNL